MGFGDWFFGGGTKTSQHDLLNQQQKGMLGEVGNLARNSLSTYQGSPDEFFLNRYQEPMRRQYDNTLAGLQATPERHSSSRRMQEYGAQQNYLSGLGQARADWLNQERLRQMQAAEAQRQRQMGYYNLGLGTKAFENVAQQDKGFLGKYVTPTLGLASSLMSLYGQGQTGGFFGQGNNLNQSDYEKMRGGI
jgi:hypothetical protein